MRTPATKTKPRPRISYQQSFSAPTRGWIANENLANPTDLGASILENWFATATGVRMRYGSELYATLADGQLPILSIFSYLNGTQEELFASTSAAINDITTSSFPAGGEIGDPATGDIFSAGGTDTIGFLSSPAPLRMGGLTGGNWSIVQFATPGGVYLVGVNGTDPGLLYDGAYFYPIGSGNVVRLNYSAQAVAFTEGAVLTGVTSGATATIYRVVPSSMSAGFLQLTNVVGAFQNGESLTATGGGAATAASAPTVVSPSITGVSVSSLSHVWIYKQRAWFVQKGSLDAWYLPAGSVGGAAIKFPLGGVFTRGGSLLFGATWSLEGGASGGLSEQCIFVSTEGEVAVYQGDDPSLATFNKVGVYRIGRPLGAKGFVRAGGDIVISTDVGLVPLSQAIQKDFAALAPAAVSFPIEVAWNERVAQRGSLPWQAEIWPTKQMFMIALPTVPDSRAEMLITNARTGAWSLYTGWDGNCLGLFKERMFFGSQNGKVIEAEVTGADEGKPYTSVVAPLYSDMGRPGIFKTAGMARAVLLSPYAINDRLSVQTDFNLSVPPPPDAAPILTGSVWGLGVWGQSNWGEQVAKKSFQNWRSVGGSGSAFSPVLQITSGNVPPPNVDLVRIDLTAQSADQGP